MMHATTLSPPARAERSARDLIATASPRENSHGEDPVLSPPLVPTSLGYLKDSITEVMFANYFLSRYQDELESSFPQETPVSIDTIPLETPAQRAHRLLVKLDGLEHRLQQAATRLEPALRDLQALGIATLEECVFRNRQSLADNVITPNLGVLQLEQDGGIISPFKGLDAAAIIDRLLGESAHDEHGMHQAEKVLRRCTAVKCLQEDQGRLTALCAESGSREALDRATRAAAEFIADWRIDEAASEDAGSFNTALRRLVHALEIVNDRRDRLAKLRPRCEAYCDVDNGLLAKVDVLVDRFGLVDEKVSPQTGGPSPEPNPIARLFKQGGSFQTMADFYGFLPVAQALRESVGNRIDGRRLPGDHQAREDTPKWTSLPGEISHFVHDQVREMLVSDPSLLGLVAQRAVARCNQGVATALLTLAQQLGSIPDGGRRTIQFGAEISARIREEIEKIEDQASNEGPAEEGRKGGRHPMLRVLAQLADRTEKEDALVDASELESLLSRVSDYLRRRHALQRQSANRSAYVARGWTSTSRQRRMERSLGRDRPTTVQLGRMDAELNHLFNALQADMDAFPAKAGAYPVSAALSELSEIERHVRESLAVVSSSLKAHLGDRERSPVLAGLLDLSQRLRGVDGDRVPRVETIAALAPELHGIGSLAAACVAPPQAESAGILCRNVELSPDELAGFEAAKNTPAPLARYLADESERS